MLRTVHVRQQQKRIHHVIRDITWQVAIARRVRRPAVRPMAVRPASVVAIYRPGHQGPMGPGRTRILAIAITDAITICIYGFSHPTQVHVMNVCLSHFRVFTIQEKNIPHYAGCLLYRVNRLGNISCAGTRIFPASGRICRPRHPPLWGHSRTYTMDPRHSIPICLLQK